MHWPAVIEAKPDIDSTSGRRCIEHWHELARQQFFNAMAHQPSCEALTPLSRGDEYCADPGKTAIVRQRGRRCDRRPIAAREASHAAQFEKNPPIGGHLIPAGF